MQQTASTLMSMIMTSHGGCAHHITLATSYHVAFPASRGQKHVIEFLQQEVPDICFLTVGAHLEDEGDMYSTLIGIKDILDTYRSKFHNTKFVWKVCALQACWL